MEEICNSCEGNGYINPPAWTVKCHKCNGRGIVEFESDDIDIEDAEEDAND